MKTAFLLVGHRHWGKSMTLRAMTNGRRRVQYWRVLDKEYFVRRMSNDDYPEDYLDLIRRLPFPRAADCILAMCPDFTNPITEECLNLLKQKEYRLFFFVLKSSFAHAATINQFEIDRLKTFGEAEVFESRGVESDKRAIAFQQFIESKAK